MMNSTARILHRVFVVHIMYAICLPPQRSRYTFSANEPVDEVRRSDEASRRLSINAGRWSGGGAPYTGSTPIGLEPGGIGVGRPFVELPRGGGYTRELRNILVQITQTSGDTYAYYVGDPVLLPFFVVSSEKKFGDDESYIIILQELYLPDYQWNIYYVLGENSDIDTRSAAADYAVMLHNKLKSRNDSYIIRKFERFARREIPVSSSKKIFPKKGGMAMYLIDQRIAKKVPPSRQHLKSDNCVVFLSAGVTPETVIIVQACGSAAHRTARKRASKLATVCRFHPKVPLLEGAEALNEKLRGNESIEEDVSRSGPPKFLKFSGFNEATQCTLPMPVNIRELESSACYMLDTKNYGGIFFWIGKGAYEVVQRKGIEVMENYINEELKLPETSVTIMEQGREHLSFIISFSEWYK